MIVHKICPSNHFRIQNSFDIIFQHPESLATAYNTLPETYILNTFLLSLEGTIFHVLLYILNALSTLE